MRRYSLLGGLLIALVVLAGCSRMEHSMNAAPTAKGMIVTNPRANMTLPTDTGSFWMEITNNTDSDDELIGAKAEGCGALEVHEMLMEKDVMVMRPVEGGKLPIAKGQTVMLEPGGLHLMCLNKAAALEAGSTLSLTLQFAKAGEIEVESKVVAPGDMEMQMNH